LGGEGRRRGDAFMKRGPIHCMKVTGSRACAADHLGRERHPSSSVRHEHALSRGAGDGASSLARRKWWMGTCRRSYSAWRGGFRLLLLAQAAQPGPPAAALRGGRGGVLEGRCWMDDAGIRQIRRRPPGCGRSRPSRRSARSWRSPRCPPRSEAEIEGASRRSPRRPPPRGPSLRVWEKKCGWSSGRDPRRAPFRRPARRCVLGERCELCRCVVPVIELPPRPPAAPRSPAAPRALDGTGVARLSRARAVSGRQEDSRSPRLHWKGTSQGTSRNTARAAVNMVREGLGEIRRTRSGEARDPTTW